MWDLTITVLLKLHTEIQILGTEHFPLELGENLEFVQKLDLIEIA